MREGSTRPAGEPGRGRFHRAQLHPSDARVPLAHRLAPIRAWWRRAWGRRCAPAAPGVGPLVGSGGAGSGAVGGLRWRRAGRRWHRPWPRAALRRSPVEVPYEVPSPLRVRHGSAAPCPAPRTLHQPARLGPWLPGCTLANHCSRFAPCLDTRRCAVSLLLWVVLGRLASL